MKKFLKGMNLLEISIILFICGVIATIFIQTVRPQDTRMRYLYNSAFMNFSNINKELYLQYQSFTGYATGGITDYYSSGFRTFPSDPDYCLQMSSIINTVGAIKCNASPDPAKSQNYTLTNGMRIIFNPGTEIPPPSGENNGSWMALSTRPSYGYRMVRIDLNGKESPNSTVGKKKDIFMFEVNDRGMVFPISGVNPSVQSQFDFDEYIMAQAYGYETTDNTRQNRINIAIPQTSIPTWFVTKYKPKNDPYAGPVPFYTAYCATGADPGNNDVLTSKLPYYDNRLSGGVLTPRNGINWRNVCQGRWVEPRCKDDYVPPKDGPTKLVCFHETLLPFKGVFYEYKTQGNEKFE